MPGSEAPSPRRRDVVMALALVVVITIVLTMYYVVYKPFSPEQALPLAGTAADCAVVALLVVLPGALGRRLLRPWPLATAGERLLVQAAVGWGALGLGMLALGLAALYYPAVMWALVVLGVLVLRREALGWLADLRAALAVLAGCDRLSRGAGAYVLLTLALGLLRALAAPVQWDALVYHLYLPRLYVEAHQVHLGIDFIYTGMPQLAEMVYTAATLLRGPVAAQAVGWAFGAVAALGLAGHAARVLSPRQGPVATAILFSSLGLATALAWAYSDWLVTALSLALLIVLGEWRATRAPRWLGLAGVLAGLALGCKYTAAPVALAVAGYVWVGVPGRSASRRLRDLALTFAGGAVLFAPWLLKNLAFTGSPTYPLLFPAGDMDVLRQWMYGRPDLLDLNPVHALLLGLRFTLTGLPDMSPLESSAGPLFLALAIALVLGARRLPPDRRVQAWPVGVYAMCGYAGWGILSMVSQHGDQLRLFYPFFPALALLGALGLEALAAFDTHVLRVSWIAQAAVVFVLVLTMLSQALLFAAQDSPAYLAGAQSTTEYLARSTGAYPLAMESLAALSTGSRVVFLWETRALYCPAGVTCEPDVIIDRWWYSRRTIGSAADIVARWRASGVTHVLILDVGADMVRADPRSGFDPSDWDELTRLRESLSLVRTIPYRAGPGYSLYALPQPHGSPPNPLSPLLAEEHFE